MTDECRPPEGTKAGTWHWLEQLGRPCVYYWHGNRWNGWFGYAMDPARATVCGYRYRGPALTPDEATRLDRELAEAQAAIRDAARIAPKGFQSGDRPTSFEWRERHAAAIARARETTDGR